MGQMADEIKDTNNTRQKELYKQAVSLNLKLNTDDNIPVEKLEKLIRIRLHHLSLMEAKKKREASDMNRNPEGKGGFGDHPENINYNGHPGNGNSIKYWMKYLLDLSVEELIVWPTIVPEDERTVAANLAFARVVKSRDDLQEFREVADRTEGKAQQSMDLTTDGKPLPLLDYVKNAGDNNDPK